MLVILMGVLSPVNLTVPARWIWFGSGTARRRLGKHQMGGPFKMILKGEERCSLRLYYYNPAFGGK